MTDRHIPQVEDIDARTLDLVTLIGRDDFYCELASLLDVAFGFHHFHIFFYAKRCVPAVLASRPSAFGYETGMHNYITYTHVINPTFRAFQKNAGPGVYMIADLLGHDAARTLETSGVDVIIEDTEAIGYRTPGWPQNLSEVIMLINLPSGTALDISFMTELKGDALGRYRWALDRLFPVLSCVVAKHQDVRPLNPETANEPGQEDRFLSFGDDVLTTREQEVVQQILIGHGSNSIALNLKVSLPTVKTHRRNIYTKLRISSQAELFNLFLLHLK